MQKIPLFILLPFNKFHSYSLAARFQGSLNYCHLYSSTVDLNIIHIYKDYGLYLILKLIHSEVSTPFQEELYRRSCCRVPKEYSFSCNCDFQVHPRETRLFVTFLSETIKQHSTGNDVRLFLFNL